MQLSPFKLLNLEARSCGEERMRKRVDKLKENTKLEIKIKGDTCRSPWLVMSAYIMKELLVLKLNQLTIYRRKQSMAERQIYKRKSWRSDYLSDCLSVFLIVCVREREKERVRSGFVACWWFYPQAGFRTSQRVLKIPWMVFL